MLTGNLTQRTIVQTFLDVLYANHSYATGGSNDGEHWYAPRMVGDQLNANTEETCTQYNMLKLNAARAGWDADSSYMDMYARQLYGGMLGNQAITGPWADPANSTGFHYMLPLGGGGLQKPWSDGSRAMACCWGTSSEAFAGRHLENIFMEASDASGVYVNLFEPATLAWPARGVVLALAAAPDSTVSTARLTVVQPAMQGGLVFSILVRVPFWTVAAGATVLLNGAPLGAAVVPGTYLNVSRNWQAGDALDWFWPATVRFETITDDRPRFSGYGALLWGDYLLAGVNVSTDRLSGDHDPKDPSAWVSRSPVGSGIGTNLLFTLHGPINCNATASVAVIPLADVMFESYTVHWWASTTGSNIHYNGSASTVIPGGGSAWAFGLGSSLVLNGDDQNMRSGDPGQSTTITLATAVQDDTRELAGLSLRYRYVAGWGPAGRHVGSNFTISVGSAWCEGADKVSVYESGELTQYPYDVCHTCYSPWVPVNFTFAGGLSVVEAKQLSFAFANNDRNLQLDLPMDVTFYWL